MLEGAGRKREGASCATERERERGAKTRCLLEAGGPAGSRRTRAKERVEEGTCAATHSQASSQSQGRSLLRRERATNQHGNFAACRV